MHRAVLRAAATLSVLVLAGCPMGCRSGGRAAGDGPARLVVVAYDGVGADLLDRWLEDESVAAHPVGLRGMVRDGARAERLIPSQPSLTAPVFATLGTGHPPSGHGIVNNTLIPPTAALAADVSGFDRPWQAEPLWQRVRAAGGRAGVVLWPGSDASSVERMADFGIWWPERPLTSSRVVELNPATAGTAPDLPSADGATTLAWTVTLELAGAQPATAELEVAVVDLEPDGRRRFDTVAFRPAGEQEWQLRDDRGWYRFDVAARGPDDPDVATWAAWCKSLYLERDSGRLRLLQGAAWRLRGYPADFARGLEAAVGPWPGPPDDRLLERWWLDGTEGIDLDAWLEQAERLDRWLDQVLAWVVEHERFSLLMAYHPLADEYQHTSLIVAPGQLAFSPGRELAAREGLKRVGRRVDASVAATWSLLDPERDLLVVVSDHGLAPVERAVAVDRLLVAEGLATTRRSDRGAARLDPASAVRALAHGGCAHLYLNRLTRPGGTLAADREAEVVARLARALADLEAGGQPLVERLIRRDEAGALGLDHPASGDLIAFLAPGATFEHGLDREVVTPSWTAGQHGYLAHHPEMHGIFMVRGDVAPRRIPDRLSAVEAGRHLARWAGVNRR